MSEAHAEIYALKDPATLEVRYIGKANDSRKRLLSHIRDSRRRNTPVYAWMRKLARAGMVPVVEVVAVCREAEWPETERRLIAQYGECCNLLNLAVGGEQPFCSVEQRAENGRRNARAIHDDPKARRIWELKKFMGQSLKFLKSNGLTDTYNRGVRKLKYAAAKNPELFGAYAALTEI
jgi:hypothetical protein